MRRRSREATLKLGSAVHSMQKATCVVVLCSLQEQTIRTCSHGKLGDDAAGINLPYNLHVHAVPVLQ